MALTIEKGVYVAAITPLTKNLSCDNTHLANHCLDLLHRGCQGVVLFGTTGEGPSFSIKEKKETLRAVISKGLNPQNIIMGSGFSSLQDTVELCQAALDNNCLACLITPPFFYKKISDEGVIAFYREVIQRVSNFRLKVILYHIPQYSGVPLTLNIVKTLFEEFPDTIVGVKESKGNLSLVKEILEAVPHCQVFVGKEKLIPQAMRLGASGTICGMANFWPELICSIYEKGDLSQLEQISAILQKYSLIPALKALFAFKKGFDLRLVRPPLVPLSAEEVQQLTEQLVELNLLS